MMVDLLIALATIILFVIIFSFLFLLILQFVGLLADLDSGSDLEHKQMSSNKISLKEYINQRGGHLNDLYEDVECKDGVKMGIRVSIEWYAMKRYGNTIDAYEQILFMIWEQRPGSNHYYYKTSIEAIKLEYLELVDKHGGRA